jgi:hypothetical protein
MNPLLLLLLGGGGYYVYKRHKAAQMAAGEQHTEDGPPLDMTDNFGIGGNGVGPGAWQPPSPAPPPPTPASEPPASWTHGLAPKPGPNAPNAFGFTPGQYQQAALTWCRRHGLSATQAHLADCFYSFALAYGDFDHYNGKPGGASDRTSVAQPPITMVRPTITRAVTVPISFGSGRNVSGIGKI